MPRDDLTDRPRLTALRHAFPPGRPTLGLAVPLLDDLGALARRAEDAGFSALWLPFPPAAAEAADSLATALAEVATATRSLGIVVSLAVDVGNLPPNLLPTLPSACQDRVVVALSFRHPEGRLSRLLTRTCRETYRQAFAEARREAGRLPVLAVGSCHESLGWLADHADGWAYDRSRIECVPSLVTEWRRVDGAKPFIQVLPWGAGLDKRVSELVAAGVDHVAIGVRDRMQFDAALALPSFVDGGR